MSRGYGQYCPVSLGSEVVAGSSLGRVRAVEDHGAGALLLLEDRTEERILPFTRAVVPVVDVAAGRLVVAPPEEITVPPPPGEEAA